MTCNLIVISVDLTCAGGAPSTAVRDQRNASLTALKARTLRPAGLVTLFVKYEMNCKYIGIRSSSARHIFSGE